MPCQQKRLDQMDTLGTTTKAKLDDIKGLEVDMCRWPKELKSQQYQVMRVVLPENAVDVGIGATWGDSRVAIQMLGAFTTLKKATEYANAVMAQQNWADVVVVEMYEWLTLPPEVNVRDMERAEPGEEGRDMEITRTDPSLQKYCSALRKTTKDDALIMKMRIEMARSGKDGAQDLATKDYSDWSNQQRIKQMRDILDNPDDYPEAMHTFAREKIAEIESDIVKADTASKLEAKKEKEAATIEVGDDGEEKVV